MSCHKVNEVATVLGFGQANDKNRVVNDAISRDPENKLCRHRNSDKQWNVVCVRRSARQVCLKTVPFYRPIGKLMQ